MYIDYLIVSLIPLFIVVVFPLPYVRFIFLYSSHSIFLFAHQLTLSLRLGMILPIWSDLTVRRILGVPPLAHDIRTESLRRPVCEKLFQPNASRCPLPYSLNWLRLSAFLIKRGEGTPTLLVCFFRTLMVKPKTPSSAWQRQPNNTWTEVKKKKREFQKCLHRSECNVHPYWFSLPSGLLLGVYTCIAYPGDVSKYEIDVYWLLASLRRRQHNCVRK